MIWGKGSDPFCCGFLGIFLNFFFRFCDFFGVKLVLQI